MQSTSSSTPKLNHCRYQSNLIDEVPERNVDSSSIYTENCKSIDIQDLANVLSSSLNEIIKINEEAKYPEIIKSQRKSEFYSSIIPDITIEGYLKRIIKYTRIEPSTLILTSAYIDKFCEKKLFILTKNNVIR